MANTLIRSEETGGEVLAVGAPDGRVFLASSAGNGGQIARVSVVDAAGAALREYELDGNEEPYEIVVTWDALNDRLITVHGMDPDYDGSTTLVVTRSDMTGYPVHDWEKSLEFAEHVWATAIQVDSAGDVFVIGRYNYAWIFVAKLAAATGTVLWAKTYTVDGATNFTVTGASLKQTGGNLAIAGARTSTQGYVIEVSTSTGTVSSREAFSWPGLAGANRFSIVRGPSDRPWVAGHGGITDPGNQACYTFATSTTMVATYDGGNYYLASKTGAASVRLRKLDSNFNAVEDVTLAYTGVSLTPESIYHTANDVVVALSTGYGVSPAYAIRMDKNLDVAGTFDSFAIAAATASGGSSVTGTYSTFTSTVTALSPAVTPGGLIWFEAAPPDYTFTLSMVTATSGTASGVLPHLVSAFIGSNSVQGNLPKLTASLAATNPTVDGSVARTLPKLTAASTLIAVQYGTVAKALPKLTAAVVGFAGTAVSAGEIKLSSLVGNLGGPGAGCSGEILTALPQLDSQLYGGQQSTTPTLPAIKGELTALSTILGGLAGQMPLPTAALVGTVAIAGAIASNLPRAVSELALIQGNVAAISATLRSITSGVSAVVGSAGSITAKLPEPTAVLTGSAAMRAVLAARLPRLTSAFPMYRFYQHVLTHVMNTHTTAVTTFENYPFNSFAKIGDKYYGAGPSGLYEIDSEPTDAVAAIPWRMLTGQLDFGSAMQKRLSDFYIAMRSAGDVALTVAVDEQEPYEYSLQATDIDRLKQRKVLLGKGLRGRYWQFGLSGTDDFDMDAYSMTVLDTARRI